MAIAKRNRQKAAGARAARTAKPLRGPRPKKKPKVPPPARGRRKLDAALRRLLAKPNGRVEAVVQLRGPRAAGGFVPPERTESLAEETLRAVERATGRKARTWHVFRHLSSFVVSGPSELIRGFTQLDVVRAVLANRQPALAPIAPVRSRAVRRPARPRGTASRRPRG
jgi:hypothetical protein